MAITAISRVWANSPGLVSVVSSDSLTTVTTSGYLTDQADNIAALNNGAFAWQDNDVIVLQYSTGEAWFTRDSSTEAFVEIKDSDGRRH